jgi:hypothetical protein
MAKVTIGGTEYEVPEMNFAALERAWPFVNEAMVSLDPMKGPAAGLCIIAAGLMEADHFDRTKFGMTAVEMLGDDQVFDRLVLFLKKKVKAKEIASIRAAVDQINEEAGLEAVKGELFPPQADPELNPSLETAPTSSQSLSPQDTVEETGA